MSRDFSLYLFAITSILDKKLNFISEIKKNGLSQKREAVRTFK
jgi:hypothetical protein